MDKAATPLPVLPLSPSAYFCAACGNRIPEDYRRKVPGTEHCAPCTHRLEIPTHAPRFG